MTSVTVSFDSYLFNIGFQFWRKSISVVVVFFFFQKSLGGILFLPPEPRSNPPTPVDAPEQMNNFIHIILILTLSIIICTVHSESPHKYVITETSIDILYLTFFCTFCEHFPDTNTELQTFPTSVSSIALPSKSFPTVTTPSVIHTRCKSRCNPHNGSQNIVIIVYTW